MTDNPYRIQTLRLEGFRAYLAAKDFDFGQKRCLAVFAPNGKGKSGVIDALEFMFSKDGTLERLGVRAVNNQAGVFALAHNLAEEKKITPRISIGFRRGKDASSGVRDAGSAKPPLPAAAAAVGACFTVDPIIRGHALRTFVEARTPEQRYADVATWLQLGPLVEVQKNLRALRSQLKTAAEDTNELLNVDKRLTKETASAVLTWEIAKVLDYTNSNIIAPLDKTLALKLLDVSDAAYVTLTERAKTEEDQLGLPSLRHLREATATLFDRVEDEKTGAITISGAITVFETAVTNLQSAMGAEARERGKAADAAFQIVWKAAEPLFAEGAPIPDVCPVCATPLADTKVRNPEGVRTHLAVHLAELADYAAAKQVFDDATTTVNRTHTRLIAALSGLPTLLGAAQESLKASLSSYNASIEGWQVPSEAPDSTSLTVALKTLLEDLDQKIVDIETKQGDHTYVKAKAKIDRLLELQADRLQAERTQTELGALCQSLTTQATTISAEIRKKVQTLLDTLQTPMNDIYRQIQGPKAAPLRLELPTEEEANQQRLNLVIDFAENRTSVQPAGYLSDSQIHSVALALRLAAIKQFNRGAPIIALDDIVTSYDADHRRSIAALIATEFRDCQVILTTHDERFFKYLMEQLETKDWQYTRITRLDADYGPRFADHKVTDEMIEARWDAGDSAANEMRQAEEEWLLGVCRDFGASIRIRPLDRAYSYERSELALALASFLKQAGLEPLPVPGVNNRFLTSLQQGVIENFGSHFQEGPYGDGSIGDERTRWEEFKIFRDQFVCPKCARKKFKRPNDIKKPVCAHQACEVQFDFVAAAPPTEPALSGAA